jgi:hypothetical protein
MMLSKQELIEAAYAVTGGNVGKLSLEQLQRLMTVTQYVTDLCLNEIERRGELTYFPGKDGGLTPIVPYMSDHMVETVLTRPEPPFSGASLGSSRE